MSEQETPGALVGRIVQAHRADIDQVHATGKAISYQGNPTYTIELPDGSLLSWPADLVTEVNDPSRDLPGTLRREDHDGEFVVYGKGADCGTAWVVVGSSALTELGKRYTDEFVAEFPIVGAIPTMPAADAILAEIEHTDLFEPETPPLHVDNEAIVQGEYYAQRARERAERDGLLSMEVRQSVAGLLVDGDEIAAIRAVQAARCGMTTGEARAIVRALPEYQIYLNHRPIVDVEVSGEVV